MKWLSYLLVTISFTTLADTKKMGIAVPDMKLEAGNVLQLEQHLKKINALDNADTFKLDFFCTKKKDKKYSMSNAQLDCKLINID